MRKILLRFAVKVKPSEPSIDSATSTAPILLYPWAFLFFAVLGV